jgi:transcriptional regulator with XRE-family HTH domain
MPEKRNAIEISGPEVRRLREEAGLSQRQLTDRVEGLSRAYISLIERSPRPKVGAELVERIADALGVELSSLLTPAPELPHYELIAHLSDGRDVRLSWTELPRQWVAQGAIALKTGELIDGLIDGARLSHREQARIRETLVGMTAELIALCLDARDVSSR